MITKDDYIIWRNHPVTEAFFEALVKESDTLVTNLAQYAGLDSLRDRFVCGSIDAVRWIIDWTPQFEEEIEKEDEDDES